MFGIKPKSSHYTNYTSLIPKNMLINFKFYSHKPDTLWYIYVGKEEQGQYPDIEESHLNVGKEIT